MHQTEYDRYVKSKYFFDWYMNMRLMISVMIAMTTNMSVNMNMTESPSPNQAVSEKGMDMLRYTRAKSTENVTVPIRWYFPNKYSGSFLFMMWRHFCSAV